MLPFSFTFPLVVRYLLITLLLTGFVLGAWSSITPIAHAATHAAAAPKHAHHATGSQPQAAVTPQPGKHRLHPATIGNGPVNGLGILPFYTYISQRLTGTTSLSVNVANGNLVIDSHNLSIAGTGLPLSLDTYYNSQMVVNGHTGIWKLSPWGMVTMISNSDGSVNYTGPSGFTATFTKNSDGSYNDAPGIDATLVKTSSGYTLTFHASGEVYVFSGGGLTADKDKNGNQITLGTGGTLTDSQGRVTTGIPTLGLPHTITDPSGRTVQYISGTGGLTGITDLAGKTTSFGYNSNQQLSSITDPLNQSTTITYGGSTRVSSITDATGARTTLSYDITNKKTTVTDANGHATVYTWDSQGRVIKIVDALSHSRSISYSNDNKPSQTIDALNTQTTYTYDNLDRVTQLGYTGGITVSYVYDANGNLSSMTDPTGTTSYTYDKDNRVLTKTLPGGTQLTYTYDPVGRSATVTTRSTS